jgi:nucleotide-binding universal stress UspA family protein
MSKEFVKTILLPMDGSEHSFKAAKYAIKLAKILDAKIIAVHAVAMPLRVSTAVRGKTIISHYSEEVKRDTERWMSTLGSIADREKVELVTDIIMNVASVSYAIANYASKHNADLIIMGTRGRSGVKKFLLGSIAHGVVTLAACPVLVVR